MKKLKKRQFAYIVQCLLIVCGGIVYSQMSYGKDYGGLKTSNCYINGVKVDRGTHTVYVTPVQNSPFDDITIDMSRSVKCYITSPGLIHDIEMKVRLAEVKIERSLGLFGSMTYFGQRVSSLWSWFGYGVHDYKTILPGLSIVNNEIWNFNPLPLDIKLYYPASVANNNGGLESGVYLGSVEIDIKEGDNFKPMATYVFRLVTDRSIPALRESCAFNTQYPNVSLKDYPFDAGQEQALNLQMRCLNTRYPSLVLSGKTDSSTIFSNVSASNPASGIGIEIVRDGLPIPVQTKIPLGSISNYWQDLQLKARYALNGRPLSTGNVRALINVDLKYN